MQSRIYASDAIWGEVARSFPLIHRYTEEFERESVQISIWLVGLAAALMGFIATVPRAFALMPRWQSIAFVVALALTVLLGLTHRVLYQVTENRTRNHLLGLRGYLSFASVDFVTPIELQDYWTIDQIISHLSSDFAIDYSFLLKSGASLEAARECYQREYDFWHKRETEKRKHLGRMLSAFSEPTGTSNQLQETYAGQPSESLEHIQQETDRLSKLIGAVRLIAYCCYGSFALGTVVLLWALILVLPASTQ